MTVKKEKYSRINVTKPTLPEFDTYTKYLKEIWDSGWLTNNGQFHQKLENELKSSLGVNEIALCSNGTLALLLAIKALDLKGEIITTPFSFVATTHAIQWANCTPVFADIDPETLNLDPRKVEEMITEDTVAIMPVHVYGNPCDHEGFKRLAEKYNLKLIYDAAHAFNVVLNDESILRWGDLSVLSFHATKVFNTFEGGAIVCSDPDMKRKIQDLKNFGFRSETEVVDLGINAKMNEAQAAMGICQLKDIEKNILKRKEISEAYDAELERIEGIKTIRIPDNLQANYSYYPILIEENYGLSRDELYELFKAQNIFPRRYFYPLISSFDMYKALASASVNNLPYANDIAQRVLCLPIYPDLSTKDVQRITKILKERK